MVLNMNEIITSISNFYNKITATFLAFAIPYYVGLVPQLREKKHRMLSFISIVVVGVLSSVAAWDLALGGAEGLLQEVFGYIFSYAGAWFNLGWLLKKWHDKQHDGHKSKDQKEMLTIAASLLYAIANAVIFPFTPTNILLHLTSLSCVGTMLYYYEEETAKLFEYAALALSAAAIVGYTYYIAPPWSIIASKGLIKNICLFAVSGVLLSDFAMQTLFGLPTVNEMVTKIDKRWQRLAKYTTYAALFFVIYSISLTILTIIQHAITPSITFSANILLFPIIALAGVPVCLQYFGAWLSYKCMKLSLEEKPNDAKDDKKKQERFSQIFTFLNLTLIMPLSVACISRSIQYGIPVSLDFLWIFLTVAVSNTLWFSLLSDKLLDPYLLPNNKKDSNTWLEGGKRYVRNALHKLERLKDGLKNAIFGDLVEQTPEYFGLESSSTLFNYVQIPIVLTSTIYHIKRMLSYDSNIATRLSIAIGRSASCLEQLSVYTFMLGGCAYAAYAVGRLFGGWLLRWGNSFYRAQKESLQTVVNYAKWLVIPASLASWVIMVFSWHHPVGWASTGLATLAGVGVTAASIWTGVILHAVKETVIPHDEKMRLEHTFQQMAWVLGAYVAWLNGSWIVPWCALVAVCVPVVSVLGSLDLLKENDRYEGKKQKDKRLRGYGFLGLVRSVFDAVIGFFQVLWTGKKPKVNTKRKANEVSSSGMARADAQPAYYQPSSPAPTHRSTFRGG